MDKLKSALTALNLPGMIWLLDLPGDGSNHTPNDEKYFTHWSDALLEAVSALDNVVLVAHSTGGMYALATPKLERMIVGLILIDSAPDAAWQKEFAQFVKSHPIKKAQKLQAQYTKNPSNALLKKLTLASASYSFTKSCLHKGISILKTLPFNYKTYEWSSLNFDQKYKAKWFPKNIPTLIMAGEHDQIIPLKFFMKSKKFNRKNIIYRTITRAGHYPWVENPKQTARAFHEYTQLLLKKH